MSNLKRTFPPGWLQARATPRGIRLSQHGVVLSEVLREPGPTHSVADVLAGAIVSVAPGPRVSVLGFAGGGLVAPLRALGSSAVVEGADLDARGFRLFQRFCARWAGEVHFFRTDALKWLASLEPADVILDDLSVPDAGDVIKPQVSWVELPGIIRNRLTPQGVAILNWLPPTNESWTAAIRVVGALFPAVRVVFFDDFENRILLCGRQLPSARALSRSLGNALRRLGSRQLHRIAVRTWPG